MVTQQLRRPYCSPPKEYDKQLIIKERFTSLYHYLNKEMRIKCHNELSGNKATELGTPQGSIISPTLANIYLHYALDLWFEKAIKRNFKGQVEIVRYADDFVCCFQYEGEAINFCRLLFHRLGKFYLEIEKSKSKLILFGRFA